jgi:hypothetical protein
MQKMGKHEHNLIQDVDTPWNSEYNMFGRPDEQRGPIAAELAERGKMECFNQAELQMVGEMVYILQPINQAR